MAKPEWTAGAISSGFSIVQPHEKKRKKLKPYTKSNVVCSLG